MGFFNTLFWKKLTPEDELEIMRRELAAGVTDTMSLKGIAAGLTGKELESAAKREKREIRDAYLKEKRHQQNS